MIDYITAKFSCTHDSASLKQHGGRYFRTRLSFNATTIEVKTVEDGRSLIISGNPAKYLQGHNIFGSNDLQGLCRDLFSLVCAQLRIKVTDKDRNAINAGLYSLSRVDIAVNFRLPSAEMVSQLIREIEWHWRKLGRNVSNYGDETVYLDQHSKIASTKFYNKSKEIRAHPLPEHILSDDARVRLQKYVEKLLRAEVTLRSPALKKEGLNSGSNWTITRARSLINEKIASQLLRCPIRTLVLPDEYSQWRPELRQIYRLWLQGDDLRLLFEERTLFRRYKSLMEFGVDIRRPPMPKRISVLSVQEMLTPERIAHLPGFANRLRLVHLPQKK